MKKDNVSPDVKILDQIYKNVRMGSESIINVLPDVNDQCLRSEITSQLSKFEKYAKTSSEMLAESGIKAEDEKLLTRLNVKAGIKINSVFDNSPSHIAEMMARGLDMGAVSLSETVSRYKDECNMKTLALANDVIDFEKGSRKKFDIYCENCGRSGSAE